MSLAEVAARLRKVECGQDHTGVPTEKLSCWVEIAVRMFEADPEFTLPARIEVLAKDIEQRRMELEEQDLPFKGDYNWVARRILAEGKK